MRRIVLSIVVAFVAMGACSFAAEQVRFLLYDRLEKHGTVTLIEVTGEKVESRRLLEGVSFLDAWPSGVYLARRTDGSWERGNVFDREQATPIPPKLVPSLSPWGVEAAISPDGNLVVWQTPRGGAKGTPLSKTAHDFQLLMLDLRDGRSYSIIEDDGYDGTARPAWSPDGRHLAFYVTYGTGEARYRRDAPALEPRPYSSGFQLRVLDLPERGPEGFGDLARLSRELAGPSLAARFQWLPDPLGCQLWRPSWSPDGSRIMFTADFAPPPMRSGQARSSGQHIVGVDGRGLRMAPQELTWVMWQADGAGLVEIVEDCDEATFTTIARRTRRWDPETGVFSDFSDLAPPPPGLGQAISWSPGGSWYLSEGRSTPPEKGATWLVNARTGASRRVWRGVSSNWAEVTWLPAEGTKEDVGPSPREAPPTPAGPTGGDKE